MFRPSYAKTIQKRLDKARIDLLDRIAVEQRYISQLAYASAEVASQQRIVEQLEELLEGTRPKSSETGESATSKDALEAVSFGNAVLPRKKKPAVPEASAEVRSRTRMSADPIPAT